MPEEWKFSPLGAMPVTFKFERKKNGSYKMYAWRAALVDGTVLNPVISFNEQVKTVSAIEAQDIYERVNKSNQRIEDYKGAC